jgi:UPF0716 protein FxsA
MWLIVAIIAIPLIEIGLFIWIGGMIGLWLTLLWVVLAGALGLIVLKGVASLGPVSLSRDMSEMRDPLSPYAHRLLVAVGGGLLLLPGFLSDIIGFTFLVPPLRRVALKLIASRLEHLRAASVTGQSIDGEWEEIDPVSGATLPPSDRARH